MNTLVFDAQINFRGTAGFVTDGPGQVYELSESYPVSRGGYTFGWLDPFYGGADRNNTGTYPPELSGWNAAYNQPTGGRFRLDLPGPGTYEIRMALGEASYYQSNQYASLYDGIDGPLLANVAENVDALRFIDAMGSVFSDAPEWRAGNQSRTVTTSGAVLIVWLGLGTAGYISLISHLRVTEVEAPAPVSVGISRGETWDVRSLIGLARSELSRVHTVLGTSRLESWLIRKSMPISRLDTWNILSTIHKTYTDTWNSRSVLRLAPAESWRVRVRVNRSGAESYNVCRSVGKSVADSFSVRQAVGLSLAESWDVLTNIPTTHVLVSISDIWKILAVVGISPGTLWRTRAKVPLARSDSWRSRARVTLARYDTWNDRSRILNSVISKWNTNSLVRVSRAGSWDDRARVGSVLTDTWQVAGGSAPVLDAAALNEYLSLIHGYGTWSEDPPAGSIRIDHDYDAPDRFRVERSGVGIGGVSIRAFPMQTYQAGARSDPDDVAGRSVTGPDGRWEWDMYLIPGEYILAFDETSRQTIIDYIDVYVIDDRVYSGPGPAPAGPYRSVDTALVAAHGEGLWGPGSAPRGPSPIDHDYGGPGRFLITQGNVGLGRTILEVYRTEDFAAGRIGPRFRVGWSRSNDSGKWDWPINLYPGIYTARALHGDEMTTFTIEVI